MAHLQRLQSVLWMGRRCCKTPACAGTLSVQTAGCEAVGELKPDVHAQHQHQHARGNWRGPVPAVQAECWAVPPLVWKPQCLGLAQSAGRCAPKWVAAAAALLWIQGVFAVCCCHRCWGALTAQTDGVSLALQPGATLWLVARAAAEERPCGALQAGARAVDALAIRWQRAGVCWPPVHAVASVHLPVFQRHCGWWSVVRLRLGAAAHAGAPVACARPLPRGVPAPGGESGGGSWHRFQCSFWASIAKGDLDLGRVGGIDGHDARHDARRRWHRLERGAQQAGAFGGVVVGRCTFVVHM